MDRYLLFSDLHIHDSSKRTERLNDCLKVLSWVFALAKEHKVDYIIFLGDLFHERHKIDVYTYQKTFEILSKTPVDFYLLLGNHDLWYKNKTDISSCKPFSAIPKVHIIARPTTLSIGSQKFDFLPYTDDPFSSIEALKESDAEILCAHIAIDGAKLNSTHSIYSDVIIEHDGEMTPVNTGLLGSWKRVFLGHYHAAQMLTDNIEYIGSPLQLSFGEAFDTKHVVLLDDHKTYIKNEFSPQHVLTTQEEIEKFPLKGNFVRLLVEDIGNIDLINLRKEVELKYSPASLEIKQIRKESENTFLEEAKAILYQEGEMLEKYLGQVDCGGLDKDVLLKIGKVIVERKDD